MALITCSECGSEVSTKAQSCPHCGAPVVAEPPKLSQQEEPPTRQTPLPAQPLQVQRADAGKPQGAETTTHGKTEPRKSRNQNLPALIFWSLCLIVLCLRLIEVGVHRYRQAQESANAPAKEESAGRVNMTRPCWDSICIIENRYRQRKYSDETINGLMKAKKYEECRQILHDWAAFDQTLADSLRALRISDVDSDVVDYCQQLASRYGLEAQLLSRLELAVSEVKALMDELYSLGGIFGIITGSNYDKYMGSGRKAMEAKAKALEEEQMKNNAEEQRVNALRFRVRGLLVERYHTDFP